MIPSKVRMNMGAKSIKRWFHVAKTPPTSRSETLLADVVYRYAQDDEILRTRNYDSGPREFDTRNLLKTS